MDAEQKAAAEKANEIFNAIATDAMDRTGGDVWGTQPQPDSQPVEQPAPAGTPDEPLSPATTAEPAPLIMGKYRSLEEAERGYHEAVRMGNLAKAEADALRAEKAVRPTGPTPAAEPDPLDEFETYGVPRKLMETAIDSRAKAQAQQAIQEYFAPALGRAKADQQIVAAHPEYQEKFTEIENFVMAQPEIRSQVEELNAAGNFLAARQIAYLNWKVANAATAQTQMVQAETARQAEAKTSRVDAGVGGTRRSDSRTTPTKTEKSPEDFDRLKTLYKNGHQAPLLRAMFDDMLPPDFDKITAQ